MLTRYSLRATAWPFPARVWAPEATPPTRPDLSGGDPPTILMARLHVYGDGDDQRLRIIAMRDDRPAVVETIDVDTFTVPDRVRRDSEVKLWHVTDTAGRVWVFAKGAGCGCGHPLKRARVDAL